VAPTPNKAIPAQPEVNIVIAIIANKFMIFDVMIIFITIMMESL